MHDTFAAVTAVWAMAIRATLQWRLWLFLVVFGFALPCTAKTVTDQGRTTLRSYARCLVSTRDRPLVGDRSRPRIGAIDRFLSVSPLSAEASQLGESLNTSICIGGLGDDPKLITLRTPPQLLRGAIYRAKFEMLVEHKALAAFSPYDPNARWHLPRSDKFAVLQAIGECTVRENPTGTRAAIESQVGTAEEDRAYSAITPSLTRCMPQDGQFTFSKALLEGIFSEALYYLAGGTPPNANKPPAP